MTGLATLFAGVGVFLFVLSVRQRGEMRVRNLREVLEIRYLESEATAMSPADISHLLARSGVVVERALGRTGLISSIRSKIDRSDWTVSPGEFVAISLATGAAGVIVGLAVSSPALAVLLGLAAFVGPYLLMNRSIERRRASFEEQFPDVLDLMAASLAAGAGISQALELVASEAQEPLASEFRRVLTATRLGASLVDALQDMSDRVGSRDLRWTVQAIVVQQRTGSRLAEILRIVADFMRGREEIRRELRALIAEGKLSAWILGILPFLIAGVVLVFRPDYMNPLFTTLPGIIMLSVAGTLMAVAIFAMSRIIKVEV